MSEVKPSYVVYLYVDYRKETGSKVLRTYFDRQKAIDFAESLSTNYVTAKKARKEPESNDEDEEEQDEEEKENGGPEYVSLIGTEFDAKLRCPKNHLTEYGLTNQDVSNLWYTRIAVDVAQHFD
jgi:hypothetical protein